MSNGSSSVLISEDYKLVALVLLIKELFIYYPIDLEDTMSNYIGHWQYYKQSVVWPVPQEFFV